MTYKTLRLILGDQLNTKHSWLSEVNDDVVYVMMEIKPESEYVTHHIQKIVGIFQAMRCFAHLLAEEGHAIRYFKINDKDNQQSFFKNLKSVIDEYPIEILQYQEPDEYRLDELFKSEFKRLNVELHSCSTEHFLTTRLELKEMFKEKKQYLMESFYRKMRLKHQILMDGEMPFGGKWNFDHENRKKIPSDHLVPAPISFSHDISKIYSEIQESGIKSIGRINPQEFIWPKDREECLEMLNYFLRNLLIHFGKYQDAMSVGNWSLYHSRISFALNLKLLNPLEVIQKVEKYFMQHMDIITIAQAEGFIRQILGWREYMRGIYWAHMPEYASKNYFKNSRHLPGWFWTGKTRMNCLHNSISQSLEYAYAHHIQRLMVTGNFSLLAGIDPDEVDMWYLGIYIDAFDWVEITNTRGMSQYADGGIVGTKPYVSSASYINKMGDYCKHCFYNHKEKFGENACPFNTLYWNFIDQHRDKLSKNPRMSMMYRLWDKMEDHQKERILGKAKELLDNVENL